MKSYTDIEQSRKLAKILPLESADYCWGIDEKTLQYNNSPYPCAWKDYTCKEYYIPCWSLAELLDVLKIFTTPTAFSVKVSTPSLTKTEKGYKLTYTGDYTPMIKNELGVETPIESMGDNAIDACVDMIEKLHELNLI